MPGPRWLARFNRKVTNRVALPLARWLPNFGVVRHAGRKSGRAYRTPIMVFRTNGHRFVVALTYGPQTEWVQNVLQSGACRLEYHGRILELEQPRLIHDPRKRPVPPWVRVPLTLLNVDDSWRCQSPTRPADPPSSRSTSAANRSSESSSGA